MISKEEVRVLHELARKRFVGWTEADVREEFIAPLLRLLGYEKDTDYDINRESQHLLTRPFLMIGSRKQQLDYALMVRKRTFWLLEAKRPEPAQITEEAVFQAHFYALHPEVACRYFGVCNGRELVLYDVRAIDVEYRPLLRMTAQELPSRFSELREVIGASSLVRHLKQRVLEDTRSLLSAEVREEHVARFSQEFRKVLADVEPIVRENRLAVWRQKQAESDRTFVELADDASLGQIPRVLLEFAQNRREFDIAHERYARKLGMLPSDSQAAQIGYVAQLLPSIAGTHHRFNVLHLLLRCDRTPEVSDTVRKFICDAIRGYKSQPLAYAQWKLEAALHRAMYKASFASPELLSAFEAAVTRKTTAMRDEDIIWRMPSVWSERNSWVRERIEQLWKIYSSAPVEVIGGVISDLERLEHDVEASCGDEIRERTAKEGDLTWYADYDRPWDYMRSCLCGVLQSEVQAVEPLLSDDDLDELAVLLRAVSDDYAVNHVDTLWLQINCMRGRISLAAPLPDDLRARLPGHRMREFLITATAGRKGRSALADGIRIWGAAELGYVELHARLDLDRRTVVVEGGRILE